MAILDQATNKYIKIWFEKCYVDDYVHVTIKIYPNKEMREKEKLREPDINEALKIIHEQRLLGEQQIDEYLKSNPIKTYNSLTGEDEYFNSLVKATNKLAWCDEHLTEYLYTIDSKTNFKVLSSEHRKVLSRFKFDESWLKQPIIFNTQENIICGEYNNEEINLEFYYSRLKNILEEKKDIIDC